MFRVPATPQGRTQFFHRFGERNRLACFDLLFAVRKDLQQCKGFLRLLVGVHIHQDRPSFAILRDHNRLAVLLKLIKHFRSVRLDKADGFDLRRKTDKTPPEPNIVR